MNAWIIFLSVVFVIHVAAGAAVVWHSYRGTWHL